MELCDRRVKVLLTGASGRLGSELAAIFPSMLSAEHTPIAVDVPTRAELDVTDGAKFIEVVSQGSYDTVVHAAAFTDVGGAERHRDECWRINVGGTRNAASAAAEVGAMLVHISTDYVFWGDVGGYSEEHTPGPVRNFYALTKLVAEEAALTAPRHLIVRTSFRPRVWPYPVAYEDVHTSQDYVDVIAPDVALAAVRADQIGFDILHIATARKSVFELARRRAPNVLAGSRASAGVELPEDVSLDVTRWTNIKRSWTLSGTM